MDDIHGELANETKGGQAVIVYTIVAAIVVFAILAVSCG